MKCRFIAGWLFLYLLPVAGTALADDHGNTMGTATEVSLDGSVPGNIETPGDLDFFRFEVPGPGTLAVYSSGESALDPYGALYDSGGSLLASDDNSGGAPHFLIEMVIPGAATIYASVRGYNQASLGAYTLHAEFEPCSPIGEIVLVSPAAGGEFNILTAPEVLDWEAAGNAEYYDLYLEMGDPDPDQAAALGIEATEWPVFGLPIGTWYWKVTARSGCGSVRTSPVRSFSISDCPVLGSVSLSQPANGVTFTTLDLPGALDWEDTAGAVAYDVYLEMGDSTPDALLAEAVTESAVPLSGLTVGTWYWSVTARNACGETRKSTTRSFSVVCPELGQITIVYPRDAESYSILNTPQRLEWGAVTNADFYDVYLEKGNPSPAVLAGSGLQSRTLALEALESGTWYWKVKASSECGESRTSRTWSFTVTDCSKVGLVALVSPERCATYTTSNPLKTLEWEVVPSATYYNVWLEKDDLSPDVMVAEGITGNTLAVQGLTEGAWYWRVLAGNDCDEEGSEVRRFNIIDDGPELGDFVLLAPAEGETFSLQTPVGLSWAGSEGAVSYTVYLEEGTPDPSLEAGVTEENSLVLSELEAGTYFWKVAAENGEGGRRLSETRSFIVNETGAGETVLYFPQFVSGDGAGTEFILVNNCAEEKKGSIIYYGNDPDTGRGLPIRVDYWSIPSRDVLVKTWNGLPGEVLTVGGVEITQEGDVSCRIEGTEFINALGSYTTVNSSEPLGSQQLFAQRSGERDTGFALYNPGTEEARIEVVYLAGGEETEAEVILGAKGHLARFLGELMPELPGETAGTLNFFAEEEREFALMGLVAADLETNAMVSITPGPDAWRNGQAVQLFETPGEAGEEMEPETVLYFPQFISGEDAGTEFFLVNNCPEAKQGSIIYYSSGNSGRLGEIVGEQDWEIPAHGVLVPDPHNLPAAGLTVGAVEVLQEGDTACRISGTEFFNALGSYTTVNRAELREAQQVFAIRNAGRNTGIALYNPNLYQVRLDVVFRWSGGSMGAEMELGAKGHRALFLDELLPLIPEGAAGTLNIFAGEGEAFALMGLLTLDPLSNALVALPISPNAY